MGKRNPDLNCSRHNSCEGCEQAHDKHSPKCRVEDVRDGLRSIKNGAGRHNAAIEQATADHQPEQQKARASPTIGEARK
jgi:hypothetical protein